MPKSSPVVRPPRQARTRASWERVLEAGVDILESDGYEGLTIAALCDRAGVTPPTIYARAPSKETLLQAIYEHGSSRVRAVVGLDEATTLREAVEELARGMLSEAALLRAMIHRAPVDEYVFRRGSEQSVELARRFRSAAGGDRRTLDACFRLAYAAIVQRIVYGPQFESDVPLSDDRFVQMLGDMAERYCSQERS